MCMGAKGTRVEGFSPGLVPEALKRLWDAMASPFHMSSQMLGDSEESGGRDAEICCQQAIGRPECQADMRRIVSAGFALREKRDP